MSTAFGRIGCMLSLIRTLRSEILEVPQSATVKGGKRKRTAPEELDKQPQSVRLGICPPAPRSARLSVVEVTELRGCKLVCFFFYQDCVTKTTLETES